MNAERLDELALRIERMALAPESVEARWMWLARPFYRLLGWQPSYQTAALTALVTALGERPKGEAGVEATLAAALRELEDNVARAERACALNGELATSHLAWLGRVTRVLARLDARAGDTVDAMMVAEPLRIAAGEEERTDEAPSQPEPLPMADRSQARLVELQLAAIDHVIDAARAETRFLDRRRRLLEAARRLMLDAAAALPLEASGVRLRKRHLAEQIVLCDRLQAAGLNPHVALLHQAKSALSRGERARLHAAISAMQVFALGAGDGVLSSKLGAALRAETPRGAGDGPRARQRSVARSSEEIFGAEVTSRVGEAYVTARKQQRRALDGAHDTYDREAAALALEYLAPGSESATMTALVSVDGCFDVGAPLSPVRVREPRTVARVVSFPTQDLLLSPARSVEDLPGAVIEDPRTILMDLAAGRLLTRKFVRYEERVAERTEMVAEARVYLLDGSTSMLTDCRDMARARMRDAILVAELATLMERYRQPDRYTRVVMFYRYFTKVVSPVVRVATADEALAAIGDVLATPRRGGTDIEAALEASFEVIRDARGVDPDLARAQIVLVTDGDALVRDEVVQRAREAAGKLTIGVSVIALGQENPALRRLVARQRAAGERAFYHHLDDDMLAELCAGAAAGRAIHLPSRLEAAPRPELRDALSGLLDDVETLEAKRRIVVHGDVPAEELAAALDEVGLDPSHLGEGLRALSDAAARDRRAVRQRYLRWFPMKPEPGEAPPPSADERDAAVVVLSTVAEVVAEMGGDDMARTADAIDVVERLLPDARLSPARFEELVRSQDPAIAGALAAVHAASGAEQRAP